MSSAMVAWSVIAKIDVHYLSIEHGLHVCGCEESGPARTCTRTACCALIADSLRPDFDHMDVFLTG